ncbi:MAG: hypothetical protein HFE30_02790 [Clostridiales bacterium]|nr:hypothetical protein [Clostridiales bacterium]
MKRIISLALAGVLSLALFSSCGQKAPTLEELNSAVKKTEALEGTDTDVTMNMKMSISGMTIDSDFSGNVKVAKEDGKLVKFLSNITATMGTESSTTSMYYADGYTYTDYAGMKTKTETSEIEALSSAAVEIPDFDLNDETVTDFSSEAVDGEYKCTVSLNTDKIKDKLGELLGEYTNSEADSSDNLNFSSASGYYIIDKNGYCSEYNFKFDMKMSDESLGEYSAAIDMTAKYNNIGEKVEITAPADLDEYSENPYGDLGDLGDMGDLGDFDE